jgi:hypothetical protein
MFGICTSNIRHIVSDSNDDCRNDSADANVRVVNPRDLRRVSVAPRTASSSSTIAISERSVNRSIQTWQAARLGASRFREAVADSATERLFGK